MQNDQVRQTDWRYLFEKLTASEREEVTFFMLSRLESRRRGVVELCRESPKHLESLSVSHLREVAALVSDEARALLVSVHPDTTDLLSALEGLTVFGLSTDEPTFSEIRDTITDIESIWKMAGGNYEADLLKEPEMLIAKKSQKPAVSTETERMKS